MLCANFVNFFIFEWNKKKLTKLCGSGKCVEQTLSTFFLFEWNEKKLTKLCGSGKCVVKEWTQSHLWSSCKFIEQSHVQGAKLENKDNIFNDVFRSLNKPNIRVREKIIFLNTYAKIIYDAIGEYRCSAQSMYKKEALEGKVIYLQLFFGIHIFLKQ